MWTSTGKMLSILAFICLCASGLSAQTSKQPAKPPLSFSWYVGYDWFNPPNEWGADVVSGWIKNNKKVDIDWISPTGTQGDKLNLMIATGELPDVMCLGRGARIEKLIDAGLLLALDPYLKDLPNLKKWAGKLNLDLLRSKDGKLYQFPNWYISPDAKNVTSRAGWAINTHMYRKLGSPALETFEDLESYLRLVKQKYPDVTPLESGDGFQVKTLVFRGMGENLANHLGHSLGTPKGTHFTPVLKDPNVRDSIEFLSRMLRDGLMNQDPFTVTRDEFLQRLIDRKVAVIATWDFASVVGTGNSHNELDPNLYDIIPPIRRKGTNLDKITVDGHSTIGWNVNVLSTSAELKAKQILAYLDWATGEEGQRILCFGPPRHFWNSVDTQGIPIWNSRYENAIEAERSDSRIFVWNWVGNSTWVDTAKATANGRLPAEKQEKTLDWERRVLSHYTRNENEFNYRGPEPSSEMGFIETDVAEILDVAIGKAMEATTDREVDKILDQAQVNMDKSGYADFLAYHSTEWQKHKKLLATGR